MPEGPSIFLLKEEISSFAGQTIFNVRGNSKAGIENIRNSKITSIKSWGKHLLICLDNELTIRIHFMLFGSYSINERKPRAERLGLDLNTGEINFYSCSVRLIEGNINNLYDWSSDVLSESWNEKKATQKVLEREEEMISDVLLNQNIFSGVGNIIKNEVLYRTKVKPESIVGNIPKSILKKIIKDARDFSFQFLEWKRIYVLRKNLTVHNKKVCPRCDLKIIRKPQIGKARRRAFYCDNCQILY
jgi:endonuclease VIII